MAPAGSPPPALARRPAATPAMAVAGLSTMVVSIDITVIHLVLPMIQQQYSVAFAAVQWMTMTYLLVVGGLLSTAGRAGDIWGYRTIFALGYGVMVLGAIMILLAPTFWTAVAARGVMAVGGAALLAVNPGLVAASAGPGQRGRALGLLSVFTFLGMSAGPAVGGWIAEAWGWQAIFWLEVPAGLLGLWLTLRLIPTGAATPGQKFDLGGAVTGIIGLSALLFAINRGEVWGWTHPTTTLVLAVAVGFLALFWWLQHRAPHPLLDPALLAQAPIRWGLMASIFHYVAGWILLLVLPYYLLEYAGLSPRLAGTLMVVHYITMIGASPLAGWASDRLGTRGLSALGMVLQALALWLLSAMPVSALPLGVVWRMMILGIGAAMFTVPNNSSILAAAPLQRQGIVSGLTGTARYIGFVSGVAVGGAVFAALRATMATAGVPADAGFAQAFSQTMAVAAGVALVGGALAMVRGGPGRVPASVGGKATVAD